jgi:hypothetical protein
MTRFARSRDPFCSFVRIDRRTSALRRVVEHAAIILGSTSMTGFTIYGVVKWAGRRVVA